MKAVVMLFAALIGGVLLQDCTPAWVQFIVALAAFPAAGIAPLIQRG